MNHDIKRQRHETISELLEESLERFIQEPPISIRNFTPATLQAIEYMLSTYGLAFVNDVTLDNPTGPENMVVDTTNSYLGKHYPDLNCMDAEDLARVLQQPKWATGIIGAKQTGMLNIFPASRPFVVTLDGHDEPVDANPWFKMNTTFLVSEQPRLASLLIALGTARDGSNNRKLSEDTCKVGSGPATELHMDHMATSRERIQGCLHVKSSHRDLGYLPTAEHLLEWLRTHEPALFRDYGLRKFPQGALREKLEAHLVAPKQGTLVLWTGETFHGEYCFSGATDVNCRRRTSFIWHIEHATRLYLGTHANDLPRETLRDMAVMLHCLETPLTVSRFLRASQPTRVQANKMSTGSTGRYTQCKRSPEELNKVEEAIAAFAKLDKDAEFAKLNPLQKQLAGVTQPLESLPFVAEWLTQEQRDGWKARVAHQ